MRSEWRKVRLGDITKWSSGGTPSKSNPSFWNGSIPWLSAKNMPDGWVEDADIKITKQGLDAGSNLAPVNSVLMLVRGSGLFNRRYISIVKKPVAFNQDVKCIEAGKQILPVFLYYLLRGYDAQLVGMLETTGIGAGKFDTKRLQEMPVCIPPLSEQRAIAAVLSALDDKIELNNRINQKLEEMAQAIFKSWFVEFEPFQDGELVESELGLIPKGWRTGTLGELVTVKYGKDHKKLSDGLIPTFGSGGIMRYVEKPLYSGESVLIPRKGTLNNVIYINEPFWTVDTMFYTEMRVKNIAKFIYFFVSSNDLAAMNSGSAVPSMTVDILNNLKVVIPHQSNFDEFESAVSSLFLQQQCLAKENQQLASLRDTLLPKLMSGELRVSCDTE